MASTGLQRLNHERREFRAGVFKVAGGFLVPLGLIFALSEWQDQSALHNALVLGLSVVGLCTLGAARQGKLDLAGWILVLGVLPVVGWVHLTGPRAHFAILYLVPLMLMGMIAGRGGIRLPGAIIGAALVFRALRWRWGVDPDWGTWLTGTFDAGVILVVTAALVHLGLRRMAKNEMILKEALEESARNAALARAASDEKSAFLARVSHELRTPLNAVLGYTELLQDEQDETEDLDRIHAAGTHLLGLIDAVLDLTNMDVGRLELDVQEQDLGVLLERVKATVEPLVQRNGNTLTLPNMGSRRVRIDGPKVEQVLVGLLSNAARFTRDGSVELRTSFEGEVLILEVVDTGIGIPPEQIRSLFQPFVKGAEADGAGLGLTLCDRMVRLMGGHIEVTSEQGRGSTFRVSLPLQTG